MHEESFAPRAPADVESPLWRYMDLARFLSLLDTSALYFSRVDRLGDPFEGAITRFDREDQEDLYFEMGSESGIAGGLYTNEMRKLLSDDRLRTYVSCWHLNQYESEAMWRLYSEVGKGIAVQTTFAKLRAALPAAAVLSLVNYIDYDRERTSSAGRFLCKRKSFEHEREVRALILANSDELMTEGRSIRINLNEVVDAVVLAPTTPQWFAETVVHLGKRFGLEAAIVPSKLDVSPTFYWTLDEWWKNE